jgi:hypothetical protein
MKRCLILMFLGVMMPAIFKLNSQQLDAAGRDSAIARAGIFVGLLARGEHAQCVGFFDSTMKAVMPQEKLKEVWDALVARVGPCRNQLRTSRVKSLMISPPG